MLVPSEERHTYRLRTENADRSDGLCRVIWMGLDERSAAVIGEFIVATKPKEKIDPITD